MKMKTRYTKLLMAVPLDELTTQLGRSEPGKIRPLSGKELYGLEAKGRKICSNGIFNIVKCDGEGSGILGLEVSGLQVEKIVQTRDGIFNRLTETITDYMTAASLSRIISLNGLELLRREWTSPVSLVEHYGRGTRPGGVELSISYVNRDFYNRAAGPEAELEAQSLLKEAAGL